MKLEDLFAKISKENLQKAREKRGKIEEDYWFGEVNWCYRYFHDSFKMFSATSAITKYLDSMVALVGEQLVQGSTIITKEAIPKLQALDLDKRFIDIVRDSIEKTKFHPGRMEKQEWQNLAAACYTAKLAADASIRYVGDILDGKLVEVRSYDYYEAFFFYLWNVNEAIRYTPRREVIETAINFGSPDVKKAYEQKGKKK